MFKVKKKVLALVVLLAIISCFVIEPAMAMLEPEHHAENDHCVSCCLVNCHEAVLEQHDYAIALTSPSKPLAQELFFYIPDVPPRAFFKPPTIVL